MCAFEYENKMNFDFRRFEIIVRALNDRQTLFLNVIDQLPIGVGILAEKTFSSI